jgi:hypothetical protein
VGGVARLVSGAIGASAPAAPAAAGCPGVASRDEEEDDVISAGKGGDKPMTVPSNVAGVAQPEAKN